jgi:hypothetical protein
MRTQLTKSLIFAAASTLIGGVSTAFAQSVPAADVPFAFRTFGAVHEAGRYEFRTVNDEVAVEFDESGHHPALAEVIARTRPRSRVAGGRSSLQAGQPPMRPLAGTAQRNS